MSGGDGDNSMNVDRAAASRHVFNTMPPPSWDDPEQTDTMASQSGTGTYATTTPLSWDGSSVASSPSLSSGFVAMAPPPWDSTDSNQSVSDTCATSLVVSAPHTVSPHESSDLGALTPLLGFTFFPLTIRPV